MRYELAVVVPTLNEVGNVGRLVELLDAALAGIAWEVIFVDDDSTDGTAEAVYRIAESRDNVRCLKRIGRRGLSSASVEGMMATGAPYLAVMDADLQHDETLLPKMLARLKADKLDIVVASRFLPGSDLGTFSEKRERLSGLGIRLARMVVPKELTDPLSGFFMLRRPLIEEVADRLNGQGFKILLDIFASAGRPLRFAELPFVFRSRLSGESKLDFAVSLEFLMLIFDKVLGGTIPARFILFVMVGLSGVAVQLALVGLFLHGFNWDFYWAQAVAIVAAMTSNFALNNRITYRDKQLRGRDFLRGLLSFYAACAIGAVISLQVAEFLFEQHLPWALASFLGAALSSVWNFGVTSTFTWSKRGRARTQAAGE
ncbi:MAG: glycosyltransferase family 2 protein [Inquilinus limosus]|uniref:Glycosyltransferase family 2 protein n=1 Tax=Inquilinus limosus TaxID=171674 RepID=A0A952FLN5_9PROT|nr:glycosyltransferase family 2 protein [Inquilinus limosus]